MGFIPEGQVAHYARNYYRTRLDDPSLLDRAILVQCSFAVPCGGKRRSGSVTIGMEHAAALLDQMLDRPQEFPSPRVETGATQFVAVVEWGQEVPPAATEQERGRMYGYSEAAVNAYLIQWDYPGAPIPET